MKQDGKTSKIKTAVLSLIVAMLVWAAITYINPPEIKTTLSNLPVRFTGEDELWERGLTVVDKSAITGLSVVIEGRRNDLLSLSDGVVVDVDVSSVSEEGTYDLTGNVTVPSGAISIDEVRFNTVPVTVDKIAVKEIPIRVKQTGSISGKLVKTEPETETVTITGAQSEIDDVQYGEALADISGLTEDTVTESGYALMNGDGAPIEKNETITAPQTRINIHCGIYDAVMLPVRAELSDELKSAYAMDKSDISITPSEVEVGMKDKRANYVSAIITDPENTDECELKESDGMYIPEGSKTVRVRAAVGKRVTKTVSVNVTVRNLAPELTARAEPVTISVSGLEKNLTAENITASVDLSDYGTGTYTVPVTVESDGAETGGGHTTVVTIS